MNGPMCAIKVGKTLITWKVQFCSFRSTLSAKD